MGRWLRAACWILTFWFLASDLYTWGGLAVTPTIGKQLREQSSLQSPLAAGYLFFGRHAVTSAGMADRARLHAQARFPEQVADTESSRQMVLTRFLAAQSAAGRLAYYGFPLLLVLSLVLHVRRPRQVRSFGRRD